MKKDKEKKKIQWQQYIAIALLHDKDAENAEKTKLLFEKSAKSYPYQNDVESEHELMEIASNI